VSSVTASLGAARTRLSASPTPRLDAELLLAQALGCHRTRLHAWPEAEVASQARARFDTLLERRAAGEPVAYLLGEREFWSLALEVTPDVLIPRPETETLVAAVLEDDGVRAATSPRLLDLGTGSGCIALALAQERPDAAITAVEQAQAALAVARRNGARHGHGNVEFWAGHWFAPLEGRRFDAIIANPPYVASADPHLQSGDVRFEPTAALDGGPDGLDALRAIAAEAPAHLASSGLLAVEHGADQGADVARLLAAAGLVEVACRADAAGLDRVTLGRVIR
jgi:release factor glutamine methyltransferase